MLTKQVRSHRKHILYVDDEPDHRELIKEIFASHDYQVSCARNAMEALRSLRESGLPDLVITDYAMPIVNGAELLRLLKQAHPQLPVIVQSGRASLNDAAEFMRMGADDVVSLPFHPDKLFLSIERVLLGPQAGRAEKQRAVRPRLFIGSSSEGLPVAEALQQELDAAAEVIIWSQGFHEPGHGFLEDLLSKLESFDFATLVLTPDDLITSRTKRSSAPRDNVLLELGICLGRLGRERTFTVLDRSAKLKLPSDLSGITLLSYQPHESGDLRAALGASCSTIKERMSRLGRRGALAQLLAHEARRLRRRKPRVATDDSGSKTF